MKQVLLAFCIIGMLNTLSAQVACDSLTGNWVNVKVETNDMYVDRNDKAATVKNNLEKFKHLNFRSKVDSSLMVDAIQKRIDQIKKNPPIQLTFNSDHTYSWHGELYTPDHHETGKFECTDNRFLTLYNGMENNLAPMDKYTFQFYDSSTMTITFINCSLGYMIFTFKRL